jgi:hypothetical protein
LWKAALETMSFMPLHQSDPIGGIIITDWHASHSAPKERFKMNIVISSPELKVSSLKVTVFKEVMDNKGNWSSAVVNPKLALDLEDKIINKAKALKISLLKANGNTDLFLNGEGAKATQEYVSTRIHDKNKDSIFIGV